MIPTKKESSMLIVYHTSQQAWTNTEKSLLVKIRDTAYQLNPDVTNIPHSHIQLYTKNKYAAHSRNEWTEWIINNLNLTQKEIMKRTGLMNTFRSTSHFNAAIILLSPNEIKTKLAKKNKWTIIGVITDNTSNINQVIAVTQYLQKNLKPDGHTLTTSTWTPYLKTYPLSTKKSPDSKQQYKDLEQKQTLQTKYWKFYWQKIQLKVTTITSY
jgi:hypothetical protein